MGIRLLVVDDNPHVSWEGRTYPVNATFQQFVAGLLDLPGSPVASITSAVPLRAATSPPGTLPLDPRIRVVGTEPFDGIAGFLRSAPRLVRANRPILRRAMAEADLLWLKVPASNAALASALAVRAGVPRFVWVAGSARAVAAARYPGATGMGARATGAIYDLLGRAASIGGQRIVTGADIVDGDGVVASLVDPAEVRGIDAPAWPPVGRPIRLAWAGRLSPGKGLDALLDAVGDDPRLELDVIGDGPERDRLERHATTVGGHGRVTWAGHIAERGAYLDRLAAADLFVFPSPAEGFPKVVLDAFAAGLLVLATPTGAIRELIDGDLVERIDAPTGEAVARALHRLDSAEPSSIVTRRERGRALVRGHTRGAEVGRLVGTWRGWWPDLPWASEAPDAPEAAANA